MSTFSETSEPPAPTAGHARADSILSGHVRSALVDYFARLDGHGATNVYALVLSEVEQPLLRTVLEHCGHNQTQAAQILGLSRSTLRKKMTQYGIS